MDEGQSASKIDDATTLGDWLFGWDVTLAAGTTGTYCTHNSLYDFSISYTLGTSDTDDLFVFNYIPMLYQTVTGYGDIKYCVEDSPAAQQM
jgi:hypothetical protein